ncbi:phosphonate ABC transporter permease [Agromyces rhizosphaerae]|uniref:Phosphonate ABC transporter permease n=1 Tax=Agromyces rhizosphaerae TaxID=88374 RepID=A0A9W6CPV6_9MICO|nr:phosphonate ABC transporter, permease protein PhnE [Agromyces rhizosphaerae]GLI26323.1 phosphonate ABC transporter permease [Agromyces rhizosphaerae]
MTSTAAPTRGPEASARPRKPAPSWALWAGIIAAAAVTVWSALGIEFTLVPFFTDATRGWFVIQEFFAPNWGFIFQVGNAWLETLSIAVLASLIGCLLGLIAAMMASKVTLANPVAHQAVKWVLSVIRSIPDIGWAFLMVAFVGVGSLAGILALVMFNIGIIAKLTSESIDAVDPGPIEAADASGANGLQRARWSVYPQVLPNFLSYSLYVFELNIRASIVIGLAGAGGIGNVLLVQLGRFAWENVSAIFIATFVVVLAVDLASQAIRRRIA